MSAEILWLWDDTNKIFRKALCDSSGKIIISDADPFEIIQDTPEDLKHLPHAQVTGNGVYKPFQLDANDYLMIAIKALPHLNDIDDVDVAAPTDGYVLYWDVATSKFKLKAITEVVGEGHILIVTFAYDSIGQGTWARSSISSWGNALLINTTEADGDNLIFKAYLDAGTYTIQLSVTKVVDGGIVDIDIDSVEVASYDTYAGATAYDQIHTDTGNVIAAAGLKTITARVDGKNASSTSYRLLLNALWLWRTA